MPEHTDVLQRWLDDGRNWAARLHKAGLSAAGQELHDEGRRWQQRGSLLGWSQIDGLLGTVLNAEAAGTARAQALLDLTVWLATALRVLQTTALLSHVPTH